VFFAAGTHEKILRSQIATSNPITSLSEGQIQPRDKSNLAFERKGWGRHKHPDFGGAYPELDVVFLVHLLKLTRIPRSRTNARTT
jgi:hypothetical protein